MGTSWDAAVFRRDLERQLEDLGSGDKLALALERKRVVVERLLARLVEVAPGEWSVTGPFALDMKFIHCVRIMPTLEIEWRVDRRSKFDRAFDEIAGRDGGDPFELQLEQGGMGVIGGKIFNSFDVHAFLAGELFETIRIKFHLRYGRISTEVVQTYGLLEFAGIEPVEVDAILLEIRVAEMLYRCSGRDGKLDYPRAEDLVDLGEIASRTHFHALTLSEAIRITFKTHKASSVPESLPRPSEDGAETFRQVAERAAKPVGFEDMFRSVAALFDPILSGEVTAGVWDAYRQCWVPGRPENGHDPASSAQS